MALVSAASFLEKRRLREPTRKAFMRPIPTSSISRRVLMEHRDYTGERIASPRWYHTSPASDDTAQHRGTRPIKSLHGFYTRVGSQGLHFARP